MPSNSILEISDVWQKIGQIEQDCHQALMGNIHRQAVPERPARDIEFYPVQLLPPKIGLSEISGRQKLLHDLANIELQAMELGLRTLVEFPDAHPDFREQLKDIVLEEAKHLRLCLQGLESLGGHWGQWPVHMGLYNAVHVKDSLLERIFIVHRYLESSGLDAGDTILRRLSGVPQKIVKDVVKVIVDEEVGHVDFGSRWFEYYCQQLNVDSFEFFKRKTFELLQSNPRQGKVCEVLRKQSGFSDQEIDFLRAGKQSVYFLRTSSGPPQAPAEL